MNRAVEAVPKPKVSNNAGHKPSNKHYTVAETRARIKADNAKRSLALELGESTSTSDKSLRKMHYFSDNIEVGVIVAAIVIILAIVFYPVLGS